MKPSVAHSSMSSGPTTCADPFVCDYMNGGVLVIINYARANQRTSSVLLRMCSIKLGGCFETADLIRENITTYFESEDDGDVHAG